MCFLCNSFLIFSLLNVLNGVCAKASEKNSCLPRFSYSLFFFFHFLILSNMRHRDAVTYGRTLGTHSLFPRKIAASSESSLSIVSCARSFGPSSCLGNSARMYGASKMTFEGIVRDVPARLILRIAFLLQIAHDASVQV